jgi:hypothetical protein
MLEKRSSGKAHGLTSAVPIVEDACHLMAQARKDYGVETQFSV